MRYLLLALALVLGPAAALAADTPAMSPAAPAAPAATVVAATPGADGSEDAPPPTWVYMVARAKLADSDLTQVNFLRHPAMKSLEDCEAERSAVLLGNSRHFSHFHFKTAGGTGYRMDFRCVEGSQYLAAWRKGERLDRYYRVRTVDGKLAVESHDTFFACRRDLRQSTREESLDHFCAQASQAITTPPVLPPDGPEAEADASQPAAGTAAGPNAAPVPAGVKPGVLPGTAGLRPGAAPAR